MATITDKDISTRRPLGGSDDKFDHVVRELIAPSGGWYVYVRKSNPVAEKQQANFLQAQYDLVPRLVSAGVSSDQIVSLIKDVGKSGALNRQFRPDLNRLFMDMGQGLVRVVVAIDVARLFRDYTDKDPASFASRMQVHRVHVLTMLDNAWVHLDMFDNADNERFRQLASKYAKERRDIRGRCIIGKENMVQGGGHSGAPSPFGWAVKPKTSRFEAEDGREKPGHLYVYGPHAEIKLRIMEISLRPDIKSLRQLRDYIVLHKILVPPFAPEIARDAFTRSLLCRIVQWEDGKSRELKMDEWFYPSTQVLKGILTNPLAVGDRLYGSGQSGVWKKKHAERQALQMDQVSDNMIRDYQEFIETDKELSICKTPEQIEMYYQVCDKWNNVDVRKARETQWEETVKNDKCIRKPGRAKGVNGKNQNAWAAAGVVRCYKHGFKADGTFRDDYFIRNQKIDDWCCSREYDAQESRRACTAFGEFNRLGRILDYHLYYHIRDLLLRDTSLLGDYMEVRRRAQVRLADVETEIAELTAAVAQHEDMLAGICAGLAGRGPDRVKSYAQKYAEDNIRPLDEQIESKQRELNGLLREQPTDYADTLTEEQVRKELQHYADFPEEIPFSKKREMIQTFVDRVGVICPDYTGDVIIFFKWKAFVDQWGKQSEDVLITWKSLSKDFREWTEDENAVLRELYPLSSGATYEEIKSRLQPGRKIDAIILRIYALDIRRPMRPKAWIDACRQADKTWGQFNPDVLYMYLPSASVHALSNILSYNPENGDWTYPMMAQPVCSPGGIGEGFELPDRIREGIETHKAYFRLSMHETNSLP